MVKIFGVNFSATRRAWVFVRTRPGRVLTGGICWTQWMVKFYRTDVRFRWPMQDVRYWHFGPFYFCSCK